MKYNTNNLRQFLMEYFSPDELTGLFFDHFRAVYEQVTPAMPKGTQVQMLLAHCHNHGRFPTLLDALAERRPGLFHREAFVMEQQAAEPETAVSPAVDQTAVSAITHPVTGKEMIFVPAGEFLYGDRPQAVRLDAFWIDRAPVTNADYARFVAGAGHAPPRHWHGRTPPANLADHPVVWVSWHDAQAYAAWAGLQLPSEQQWERAARGVDGRIYPWGEVWFANRCNSAETGIKATTPVGRFSPQGDSPAGCVDMAGNVWEWTASWFNDSQARRAVRGGAWNSNQRLVNATARRQYDPTYAHDHYGFRLAAPAGAFGQNPQP